MIQYIMNTPYPDFDVSTYGLHPYPISPNCNNYPPPPIITTMKFGG